MPTHWVELSEDEERFVNEQVSTGRYASASELLEAGLRLLEHQHHSDREKLSVLRSLAEESFQDLDAGHGVEIRNEVDLADLVRRIGHEVRSGDSTGLRGQ